MCKNFEAARKFNTAKLTSNKQQWPDSKLHMIIYQKYKLRPMYAWLDSGGGGSKGVQWGSHARGPVPPASRAGAIHCKNEKMRRARNAFSAIILLVENNFLRPPKNPPCAFSANRILLFSIYEFKHVANHGGRLRHLLAVGIVLHCLLITKQYATPGKTDVQATG